VVDLDQLFGVSRAGILVDRSRLKLVRSSNLPKLGCHSTERASPRWSGCSHRRAPWRGRRPCHEASLVIFDAAEVSGITTVFSLLAVLGYLSMCIIVSQASISTGRGCFFTSGALCPIGRPVSNGGLASMVGSQQFYYDNLTHRFSSLLGQSEKWGVLWDHALD
jgi:hypothetical protein